MTRPNVRLDQKGIAEHLVSLGMQRAIKLKTEQVARGVEGQNIRVGDRDGGPRERDLPVEAEVTLTDRAHGRVTITHPAGQAVQAKHGALTKAAEQAGLEVKGEKR